MNIKLLFLGIIFSICQGAEMLTVTSSAFTPGAPIPKKYTCDGQNVNPQIGWSEGSAETKSYVLICDDPDAPRGTFVHWIVYDIRPTINMILEEQTAEQIAAKAGLNSWGKKTYGGPCPPSGKHRYYFKVYAADVEQLDIPGGPTKDNILQALQNHTVAQGQVMGTYARE